MFLLILALIVPYVPLLAIAFFLESSRRRIARNAQRERDRFKQAEEKFQKKIEAAEAVQVELQSKLDGVKTTKAEESKEKHKLNQSLKQAKDKATATDKAMAKLETEIAGYKKELEAKSKIIESREKEFASAAQRLKELNLLKERLENKSAEVETLKKEVAAAKSEATEALDKVKVMGLVNQGLRKRGTESETKLRDLQNKSNKNAEVNEKTAKVTANGESKPNRQGRPSKIAQETAEEAKPNGTEEEPKEKPEPKANKGGDRKGKGKLVEGAEKSVKEQADSGIPA